jgi:hypothetical protein
LIDLTKFPDSIDLSNLRDSPPPQQTQAPVTNDVDTGAGVEALVQLAAATSPPEVIDLSDIQPAAQLLANRFNHAPPSKRKHDGNNKLRLVPLPCGNIVWDVPGLYDVKSYTKIREWEKYEKIVKAITKHLQGKKYVGTPMGKKLLALALVHSPSLSARGAENIIACIIGSFSADSGIPFEPEQVANSCVKRNALTTLLKKNGVKTIHELRELVEDADLYLACDKGNCQKGINAFVKYLCWWDKDKKRVLTHILDIDAADNKSSDAASAIDTLLRKIDRPETKRKLAGHGSDAGGGGTGTSLCVCLK